MSDASAAPTIGHCGSSGTPTYPFDYKCDHDGNTPCTFNGVTGELTCEIASSGCGATSDPRLFAVSTGATQLSVYGKCHIGGTLQSFCCRVDDPSAEIDIVTLLGSSQNDLMGTYDFDSTSMDLAPTHGGPFVVNAWGLGGVDEIQGSFETSANYVEYLHGGAGNDTVKGNHGDDVLTGGTGTDQLKGGAGRDRLHGGDGADTLWGDGGEDVLYGGRNADTLKGGTANDTLCDTTAPNGTCPSGDYVYGDGGESDRAMMIEHASCPASGHTLIGDGSVEEARDDDFTWDAMGVPVIDDVANVQPGGSPSVYTECAALISAYGN